MLTAIANNPEQKGGRCVILSKHTCSISCSQCLASLQSWDFQKCVGGVCPNHKPYPIRVMPLEDADCVTACEQW